MGGRLTPRRALVAVILAGAALAPAALAVSTHQEYVAQVNPICKDAARQAKRIPARIKETGMPLVDALRRTRAYTKLLGKTLRRIAAVEPALGEEAQVKSWLRSNRRTLRLIRKFLRSASRGDFRTARALIKKILRSQRTNRKRAALLGLPACARTTRRPG